VSSFLLLLSSLFLGSARASSFDVRKPKAVWSTSQSSYDTHANGNLRKNLMALDTFAFSRFM
jgi:hypothetical protein